MKYYINIIKNKNYAAIILLLFFGALTLFSSYIFLALIFNLPLGDVLVKKTGYDTKIGIFGFLENLIFIYFTFIWLPKNAKGSQTDSDYNIQDRGDEIYVQYKKYEFLLKRKQPSSTDFFFRDMNHKFVPFSTGYQIYSYLVIEHPYLFERKINGANLSTPDDAYYDFKHRIMTDEEKQNYIKIKNIKNHIRPGMLILAIFFGYSIINTLIQFIHISELELYRIIIYIFLLFIDYTLCKITLKASIKWKKQINGIMNNESYVTDCYVFDKKTVRQTSRHYTIIKYYIKVTDGKNVLNHWFEITEEHYLNSDNLKVQLYIFYIDKQYTTDIISSYGNNW